MTTILTTMVCRLVGRTVSQSFIRPVCSPISQSVEYSANSEDIAVGSDDATTKPGQSDNMDDGPRVFKTSVYLLRELSAYIFAVSFFCKLPDVFSRETWW